MALFAIVARGTIVLFAIVVLALAVPPLYVGCMLASRGSTMFLATPLPDYLPGACIGASLLLLSKFVVTIRGACSPDRKLSLALAMIVTLILMTLSACARLQKLHLGNNKIVEVPSEILSALLEVEELHLYKNKLESLPPELGCLTKCHTMSFSTNNLRTLPDEVRPARRARSSCSRLRILTRDASSPSLSAPSDRKLRESGGVVPVQERKVFVVSRAARTPRCARRSARWCSSPRSPRRAATSRSPTSRPWTGSPCRAWRTARSRGSA